MKTRLFIVAFLILSVGACRRSGQSKTEDTAVSSVDSLPGQVVADTIIYDVIIANTNPDDTWTTHCLAGLDRNMLIGNIFDMVYAGRANAYNHETGEKLTPKQLEDIEAGQSFSRDNIGMIQFTEVWYMNQADNAMTKEVLSMVLGYNYDTPDGQRLHKALFRVEL
jgi:hypothetical protein